MSRTPLGGRGNREGISDAPKTLTLGVKTSFYRLPVNVQILPTTPN